MNEPRQNSFSANAFAWRLVAGWNQKYPDVCGTAIVPPFNFRNLWCGCSNTNEMIGQSFPSPAKALTMDEARRFASNIAKLPALLTKK